MPSKIIGRSPSQQVFHLLQEHVSSLCDKRIRVNPVPIQCELYKLHRELIFQFSLFQEEWERKPSSVDWASVYFLPTSSSSNKIQTDCSCSANYQPLCSSCPWCSKTLRSPEYVHTDETHRYHHRDAYPANDHTSARGNDIIISDHHQSMHAVCHCQ